MSVRFKRGTWHNALVEIRGSEMVAQIDDQPALYIKDNGLLTEKPRLVLINYGRYAWFDNLKVWKADANESWTTNRERVVSRRRK